MFYNDDVIMSTFYQNCNSWNAYETYKLVKYLVDNDCDIDGISFESHINTEFQEGNNDAINAEM